MAGDGLTPCCVIYAYHPFELSGTHSIVLAACCLTLSSASPADMDVVNYLFCDVRDRDNFETWPFT